MGKLSGTEGVKKQDMRKSLSHSRRSSIKARQFRAGESRFTMIRYPITNSELERLIVIHSGCFLGLHR